MVVLLLLLKSFSDSSSGRSGWLNELLFEVSMLVGNESQDLVSRSEASQFHVPHGPVLGGSKLDCGLPAGVGLVVVEKHVCCFVGASERASE